MRFSHGRRTRLTVHAGNYYSVIANMRGKSAEEVAGKILASELLRGLQVRRNSAATVTGSTQLKIQIQSSTLSKSCLSWHQNSQDGLTPIQADCVSSTT